MTPSERAIAAAWPGIRAEILSWNATVNLVSRDGADRVLDVLGAQCRQSCSAVLEQLARDGIDPTRLAYADVGSGNGLPGLIWAAGLRGAGCRGPVWLVEPRRRRAWVLARIARQLPIDPVSVVEARWGAAPLPWAADATPCGDILLSLKALRLTDREILDGAVAALPPDRTPISRDGRLLVARFLPSGARAGGEARDVQAGRSAEWPGGWRSAGDRVLEGASFRISLSIFARDR